MPTTKKPQEQVDTVDGPAQVVSVRFAPQELARLKAIADAEGVPLSTVVRRAVFTHQPSGTWGTQRPRTASGTTVTVSGQFTAGSSTTTVNNRTTIGALNGQYQGSGHFTVR